jgi:RimJ/RimL family protein N-acetyltransferase
MTTTIPRVEAYPKTVMLGDGTAVILRPLAKEDKVSLLDFFRRVPAEERHYLKEDVTSLEVIEAWTSNIDSGRVIPIVALVADEIVADATLHRSRSWTHCHMGELRIVVDPTYRNMGLGWRLIRELTDIADELGLQKVVLELEGHWKQPAIIAAGSLGFREAARLKEWVRDYWGDYQDLVIMELPLTDHRLSQWY